MRHERERFHRIGLQRRWRRDDQLAVDASVFHRRRTQQEETILVRDIADGVAAQFGAACPNERDLDPGNRMTGGETDKLTRVADFGLSPAADRSGTRIARRRGPRHRHERRNHAKSRSRGPHAAVRARPMKTRPHSKNNGNITKGMSSVFTNTLCTTMAIVTAAR